MKKIYLAIVLTVFLPMLASAAPLGASVSTDTNVSPSSPVQLTSLALVTAPAFAWGFYPTSATNPYKITFTCTNNVVDRPCNPVHDMQVTSFDPDTGAFTASGTQEGYPLITWNASGTTTVGPNNTTGTITFHIAYNPESGYLGYTVDASGTITSDGHLSGTAVSPQDGNTYVWTMDRLAKAVATFKKISACDGWNGWDGTASVGTSTLTKQSASDARIDGSIWAQDAFNWSLRVRQISTSTEGNQYCGIVKFTGRYVTPTGTEYSPYQPTSTNMIIGRTGGDFVGSEIFSFTADGVTSSPNWNSIWGWMGNFNNPNITNQNQVWAYAHKNATQQWIETYDQTK